MKDLILYCFLGSEKSECQSQFDVNPLLFYVHIGEREEIPIRNYLSPIHSDVKIRIIILPVLGRFDIPGTIINGSSPSQLSSLYYTTPNSYQTEKVTYDVSISNNGRSESCYIAIRACYTSCSACDEEITLSTPTSTVNHNCNDCRNGYIHLEDSKNCYLPDHIGDKIYYDPSTPDDGIFRNCPTGCLTCSIKTSLGTVSCDSCDNDNLYYGKEGDLNGCYNEAQCLNCFLDTSQSPPIWKECLGSPCIKRCYYLETNDTFYKCYDTCLTCFDKQIPSNTDNCFKCNSGFHFIDQNDDHSCFPPPTDSNYIFNSTENKYYKCYENCATCSDIGTFEIQKCLSCKSPYSFYEDKEPSNCLTDSTNEGYWYNNTDKTFYLCYPTCKTCDKISSLSDHKCKSCKDELSFYEGKNNNCENNTGNNDGYAYDNLTNTFYNCFSTCKTCDLAGNTAKHECRTCKKNLSFYQHKIDITNCEDDTGPNEGYYYIEAEDTYYQCNPLCKYCYTNATSNPIHDCIECIDTYYFIYGTNYCINTGISDTNYTISEYYFDTSDNTFKKCHSTCETCLKGGSNTVNNCDTCKIHYSFIETELVEMNCVPEIGYDGFYYFNGNNTYMRCYESCKTCTMKGDIVIHECATCINGIIKDPTKSSNCVKQCPDLWYIDENDNYLCQKDECPFDYPLLIPNIEQCVQTCPKKMPYDNNGTCTHICPFNTFPINYVCSKNCYPDSSSYAPFLFINHKIDECIKEINKTIIHYLPFNKPIDGIDFAFEVYLTNSHIRTYSNISFINFTSCELQLREFYDIPMTESIIFAKFDINRTNITTYKVEYTAYNIHGEYLDLSHCHNANITVYYPIKLLHDSVRQYAISMHNKSIDVFNANDIAFNTRCYAYHVHQGDVTLSDRRQYIFRNISYCELNCAYVAIDYDTMKAQCNYSTKSEINTNPGVNNTVMVFPKEVSWTNTVIGKCYYMMIKWNNIKYNYIFNIILHKWIQKDLSSDKY